MKLSIYTSVRNGLRDDYHVVDMITHHLPLADEVIVNDGNSSDGTYEALSALAPKVKVFRSDWGKPHGKEWLCRFKNAARQRCTGDWCILLDCDEFIPEWEFDSIRELLELTDLELIPSKVFNFYGNYRVYHIDPARITWPSYKVNIHRNDSEIVVVGDGSHVCRPGECYLPPELCRFTIHHFGGVRNAARIRQRWRTVYSRIYSPGRWRIPLPAFMYTMFPHSWKDTDFLDGLAVYDGPHVKAVRDNPAEFVRDDFELYHYLSRQAHRACVQ